MLSEQSALSQSQVAAPPSTDLIASAQRLNRLIHLNEESQRGFEIAAQQVRNRGLQIMLKIYAQQRRQFAEELRQQFAHEGHVERASRIQSIFASLHRGWIDVRTAIVIRYDSMERMVVNEARRIEKRIVLKEYQRALKEEYPDTVGAVLEEQYKQVQSVHKQLEQISGRSEHGLLLQLFDSEAQALEAVKELHHYGLPRDQIEVKAAREVMESYASDSRQSRIKEGAIVALFIGAVIGFVIGVLTGLGVQLGSDASLTSTFVFWLGVIGSAFGVLFGGLFGLIASYTTTGEDNHIHQNALEADGVLVLTTVDNERTHTVRTLLQKLRWQSVSYAAISA